MEAGETITFANTYNAFLGMYQVSHIKSDCRAQTSCSPRKIGRQSSMVSWKPRINGNSDGSQQSSSVDGYFLLTVRDGLSSGDSLIVVVVLQMFIAVINEVS